MKKVAFLLSVLMIFTLLSACQNSNGNGGNTSAQTTGGQSSGDASGGATDDSLPEGATRLADGTIINPPGVFPIVVADQPYELTVFMPLYNNVIIKDHLLAKAWEEKTNIKMNFMEVSSTEQDQQINLMLASGENLPDVFSMDLKMQRLRAYGSTGMLLELNDLIDQWCVNVDALWEFTAPYGKVSLSTPEGKLYGLPSFNGCFHCNYQQRGWINQLWLDNLGLQVPTTTDEYYNVLKAFKEQDANNNGDPNDEVPLVGATNHWNSMLGNFLMNAFVINKPDDRINMEDGKMYAAYTTPEWKEGLHYYRNLYAEGLIDPESFVMTVDQVTMLAANPNGNQVGSFFCGVSTMVSNEAAIASEYVVIPPLKGPSGKQETAYYPDYPVSRWSITSNCKNPEVAIRLGDSFLFIPENNLDDFLLTQGSAGGYDMAHLLPEDTELRGLNDEPAKFYVNTEFLGREEHNYWLIDGIPAFTTNWTRDYSVYSLDQSVSAFDGEKSLYQAAKIYQDYKPAEVVPPLQYSDEDQARVSELTSTLKTYVDENFAAFITGRKDIDAEWDSYVKEVEAIGVNELLGLMTAAYEKMYK